MTISIFELFNIGIGPSSSHTIGPMRAAKSFVLALADKALLKQTHEISIELHGSLAFTGRGHGTDSALIMGLECHDPETIEPADIPNRLNQIKNQQEIITHQKHKIVFDEQKHIIFNLNDVLPGHSNGMKFSALDKNQNLLFFDIYYSIGGGFIMEEAEHQTNVDDVPASVLKYPFDTCQELLAHCSAEQTTMANIILANEQHWRNKDEITQQALLIWQTMEAAIDRGCQTQGILPGGLNVKRRAPGLYKKMQQHELQHPPPRNREHLNWLNLYAMAVNEENAAGHRVVTAPTNGASGLLPAVLKYYRELRQDKRDEVVVEFLLTAGAIGILFKKGASISGAEMGCMGEVGVACSMSAGALTAILGGEPQQVEQAAEIAIEHHLGLTCDPIKGLVQIPCIERNAMGAVKAVNAAHIALQEDGHHIVTLDKAIKTMKATGDDMCSHYKETSQGGLAVNVPEC